MKLSDAERVALAHPTWADAYLGALAEWLLFGPSTAIVVFFAYVVSGGEPLYSLIALITAYIYAAIAGFFATGVCVFLAMTLAVLLRIARNRFTHIAAYFALGLTTATLVVEAIFPPLGFASDLEFVWPIILVASICVPTGWAISLNHAAHRQERAALAFLAQ